MVGTITKMVNRMRSTVGMSFHSGSTPVTR